MLDPKIEKLNRGTEQVHLSLTRLALKNIGQEMERLIDPESKAEMWGEAWEKEIEDSSDEDGIDWE